MRKKLIICLIPLWATIFTCPDIAAQDSLKVMFYEQLKDDSVVMFFNKNYNFTEKSCFVYQRFTRIDENGDFFHAVIDVDTSNRLLGKGWYMNGLKNGYFEMYHDNGEVKSAGIYESGMPIGDWYYFYSNGKPERHLNFSSGDTLLMDYYDETDKQLVKNGNGYFNGHVAGIDRFYRNEIIASGQIVNGKQDGEWKSTMGNYPYCTEKFTNGTFIKGNFPNAMVNRDKSYTGQSYLKTLFLPSYFNRLEEFHVTECFKGFAVNQRSQPKTNIEYNLDNFRSFIKDAIDQVLNDDMRNGKYLDYNVGDNLLKISFIVNNEGTPKEYRQITSWGNQYYYPITNALTIHAKMPTTASRIFFNLTVIKREGNNINYNYNFSKE